MNIGVEGSARSDRGARDRGRCATAPSRTRSSCSPASTFPSEVASCRRVRRSAAGPTASRSRTTRSRCSARVPTAAGASRSSAARASTASVSRPDGRETRFPALGDDHRRLGRRPGRRRGGRLGSGAQRGRPRAENAARAARPSVLRTRDPARPRRGRAHRTRSRNAASSSCAPLVFAHAEHDAVAARDRRRGSPPRSSRSCASRSSGSGWSRSRADVAPRRRPRCARDNRAGSLDRGERPCRARDPAHASRRRCAAGRRCCTPRARYDSARSACGTRARSSATTDLRRCRMADVRYDQASRIYPGTDDARRGRARPRRSTTASSWCSSAPPAPARRRRCACSRASRRSTPARSSSVSATSPTCAPKNRDVAMVFQNYALYPYLTVEANIGFPLKIARRQEGRRDGSASSEVARAPRPRRVPAQEAGPAVGRPAPASRDGPRDRARAEASS